MSAEGSFNAMRLLITGASGFLGSAVVESLSSRLTQTITALHWRQAAHGSLLSRECRQTLLDEFKPDTVLHLAWQSTSSPMYETHPEHYDWSRATLEFLTECSKRSIWFLCAGSAIDDRQGSISHLDSSSYLESKRLLKDRFSTIMQSQNSTTWLQIQYAFSVAAMRPRLLRAVIESQSPHDFRPDNPDALHDFIHIDDVANAITSVLSRGITSEISIGTGFMISTADFVEAVKFQCGYRKTKPSMNVLQSASTINRLTALGWSPTASCQFLGIEAHGS